MHDAKSKAFLKLHNAPIFKNLLKVVLWAALQYSFNLTHRQEKRPNVQTLGLLLKFSAYEMALINL